MSQLLIKESYLKAKSLINDNVDMKALTPVIEWVQDFKIIPLIGQDLFDLIITQSTPTTTLTAANQILLDDHILKAMIHYIMSDAVITMTYKFTNVGMVKRGTGDAVAISKDEARDLQDYYKNKAEEYGQRMINYIKSNPNLFPAYYTVNGVFAIRPSGQAYDCPIFLPDFNNTEGQKELDDLNGIKRINRY